MAVYVSMLLSPLVPPTPSPPPTMSISLFSMSSSTAALQIGSSVPSFSIPYICLNIRYLLFSFSKLGFLQSERPSGALQESCRLPQDKLCKSWTNLFWIWRRRKTPGAIWQLHRKHPGQQKLRSPSRDASARRIRVEAGFCLCTLLIWGHLKDKLQKHPQ